MEAYPPPNRGDAACCEPRNLPHAAVWESALRRGGTCQHTVDNAEHRVVRAPSLLLGCAAQDGANRGVGTCWHSRRCTFSKGAAQWLCHVLQRLDRLDLHPLQMASTELPEYIQQHLSLAWRPRRLWQETALRGYEWQAHWNKDEKTQATRGDASVNERSVMVERGQDQHTSDAPVGCGSVDSAREAEVPRVAV